MDKYAALLKTAKEKAGIVPSDLRWKIPYFRFVGAEKRSDGRTYYYYQDGMDGEYYYESDFDREMRVLIQKNKFLKYAKK